jgi:nitrous oxidase accessory protein NosD
VEYRPSIAAIAWLVALLVAVPGAFADESISGDAAWSGTVRVTGTLVVEEGATLVIAPGTTVLIDPAEKGDEGLARSGILVKGSIVANGERENPIEFTSSSDDAEPGDWGELQILNSTGSSLKYCVFSYGGWGVHVHDSALTIRDSEFHANEFGGIRGRGEGVEITGCDITGMDIGIRFWKGAPKITRNRITGNMTGIFFREGCGGAFVNGNDLSGNEEYAVKLGDMHAEDVDVSGNYWGDAGPGDIAEKIFDRKREPYIGNVLFEPVLSGSPE